MSDARQLLIVAHAPSSNTRRMAEAALRGAHNPEAGDITARWVPPLDATPDDVLAADGILLGTTENLGYMSGALKDFFDRIYYPCLEHTEGLPYALYVRAGKDGTGTQRAVATITTGLRWDEVQAPLVCRGDWNDKFESACEELGLYMAAGLDARIF